jgi:adenosylcobinamide-phosphate synthase
VRLGGETLHPKSSVNNASNIFENTEFDGNTIDANLADTVSTPGREAEPAHLRSVVGLVWRLVVLWMLVLALLTLANLLG